MKALFTTLILASLVACGSDNSSDQPASQAAVVDVSPKVDKACLEAKNNGSTQLAKSPVSLCKTLRDGTISTLTVYPGDDEINPDTCEIHFDGAGWISALTEMEYRSC